MEKHQWLFAVFALMVGKGFSHAYINCTKASKFQPELCRIKLPPITGVTFEENAMRQRRWIW
jgi:hypothetical protein